MASLDDINTDGLDEFKKPEEQAAVTPLIQETPTGETYSNSPVIPDDDTPPVSEVQDFINDPEGEAVKDPILITTPKVDAPGAKEPSFLDMLLSKAVPVTEQRAPRKMMVFSHPGVGKTSLWGTIPNNFIIDTEDGRTVLSQNREHMAEGVVVLPFKTFEGLTMTIDAFKSDPPELKKFGTITIDTANNLRNRGFDAILKRNHERSPGLSQRYLPEEDGKEYQEVNNHMMDIFQGAIDSQRDVIISCHAKTFESKKKADVIRPDFSESLSNRIMGMMDVVAYMYLANIDGEVHRVMKFVPSVANGLEGVDIQCKSRVKGLPDNMVDPTWEKITEIWKD